MLAHVTAEIHGGRLSTAYPILSKMAGSCPSREPLLSGHSNFSFSRHGVAMPPFVQPRCSPSPALCKDLQIQTEKGVKKALDLPDRYVPLVV